MIVVTLFCPLIFLGNVVHYKFPASSSHLTGVAQGNNGQMIEKGAYACVTFVLMMLTGQL